VQFAHALQVIGERITQGPTLAFLILILVLIIGPRLAEKLRLPAMVGLVLAGMAVGPHAAGIFRSDKIELEALGDFGLLYLMFAAGLELDLKLFVRMKRAAITFALLSFAVPFSLGLMSAKLIGYHWAAALLMGSNWGSHTLVTYPMVRQMGLARNRAVATVVGATAVTDTSALLVLAGVAASVKKSGGLGTEGAEIAIGLAALALWTLFALPRVARWFFARVGADRSYRYVFGLAAFLSGAVLAEAAGIDGIVGAFFAGLGLNRAIPARSPLMEQIQSLGSGLFIPIFLVSVGVLLDPKVMIDPKTLLVALVFTVAVLGGKSLAAVMAGRAFHFTWPEIGVMSGLSGSQAAATLATTLVGARLGLFDKTTINAVLVVILASLVVTPALVSIFGKKVPRSIEGDEALGSAVLVPVWGESTRPVLVLAGQLAAPDCGMVLAASFATEDATESQLASQRRLKDQAEEWLGKAGLEARAMFRVSRSLAAGLLQSCRAEDASLLLMEWHFEGLEPGTEAANMLANAPVATVLVHGSVERFERLVILARAADVAGRGSRELQLAAELAMRLAHGRTICLVGASVDPITSLFTAKLRIESIESADPLAWAKEHARDTDLCILAGLDAAREALERDPHFAAQRFMVAVVAHQGGVETHADDGSGLVVGRSITEEAGGHP
jgi:Kef-type K+ transport system membrane component KefB